MVRRVNQPVPSECFCSGEGGTRTVVDEGGGPEPQLSTVLARGVHDAEVVLAVAQQQVLLALRQLGDAAHQVLDLIVSFPATSTGVGFHLIARVQVKVQVLTLLFRTTRTLPSLIINSVSCQTVTFNASFVLFFFLTQAGVTFTADTQI